MTIIPKSASVLRWRCAAITPSLDFLAIAHTGNASLQTVEGTSTEIEQPRSAKQLPPAPASNKEQGARHPSLRHAPRSFANICRYFFFAAFFAGAFFAAFLAGAFFAAFFAAFGNSFTSFALERWCPTLAALFLPSRICVRNSNEVLGSPWPRSTRSRQEPSGRGKALPTYNSMLAVFLYNLHHRMSIPYMCFIWKYSPLSTMLYKT